MCMEVQIGTLDSTLHTTHPHGHTLGYIDENDLDIRRIQGNLLTHPLLGNLLVTTMCTMPSIAIQLST